jgi:di/tricarboxylate transporter
MIRSIVNEVGDLGELNTVPAIAWVASFIVWGLENAMLGRWLLLPLFVAVSLRWHDRNTGHLAILAPLVVKLWSRMLIDVSDPFVATMFYLQTGQKQRADERTRTSDLTSLRVCGLGGYCM